MAGWSLELMAFQDEPGRVTRRSLIFATGAALGGAGFSRGRVEDPVLQTRYGPVSGVRQNDGIYKFLGIRYGRDTRQDRFQAPRPPAPWAGVRSARAYGAACPQRSTEPYQSEDCLFLNVWTPEPRQGGRRPVMVYFHGGAYSTGSGSSGLYDGSRLAAQGDVVVITVNHRLNAFGYLSLRHLFPDTFPASGNVGQLDLILALNWVRDHASQIGGDPDRVMVFGQSGGGAKIATLMATPAAQGLFQAAATMSGQQVTASGPLNAGKRADTFLRRLGMREPSIQGLRELPSERLVEALEVEDPILPYGRVYFGPVLDDVVLHRHPFYPGAAPQSLHIPMIIGNTRDETRAFLRGEPYNQLSWDDLPQALAPNLRVDISPDRVISEYRSWYPDLSPTDLFYRATTAARSWRGAIIEAEERARAGAPAFVYQLDWGNPYAPHTFDIPLVFGNLDDDASQTGTDRAASEVSTLLSEAFIALARAGHPQHAGLPPWTGYTLENRETMVVDRPCRMESDPRGRERALFSLVPYVQPGT